MNSGTSKTLEVVELAIYSCADRDSPIELTKIHTGLVLRTGKQHFTDICKQVECLQLWVLVHIVPEEFRNHIESLSGTQANEERTNQGS